MMLGFNYGLLWQCYSDLLFLSRFTVLACSVVSVQPIFMVLVLLELDIAWNCIALRRMGSRQPNGFYIVQSTVIQTPDGTFSNRSVLQSQYQEQYSRGSRLISSRTAEFSGSPPADADEFDAMSAARGHSYKLSNNKNYDLCLR